MGASHRLLAASAAAALALALASCGGGGGGPAPAPPPPAPAPPPVADGGSLNDPTQYSVAPSASLPADSVEAHAVTKHSITLPTGTLAYTATTGHLIARNAATGAPRAKFFHITYTLDNAPAATRPVTFFYNGGPGSASVWLHLGSFGPKRLAAGFPSATFPASFPLVDNLETLLDTTDLVFVDAVGTGYSQAIAPNTNQTFWGVDSDAAVFRDFVVRWLAAHNRSASPKYLLGESYGGIRTPILAHLLEAAGVQVNGIVLHSPALNYATNCAGQPQTVSCAGFVPSYSQAGAYHQLAPAALPDRDANAQQMRNFVSASYDPAIVVWFSQQTPAPASLADQLQALTGLPAQRWTLNPNVDPGYFRNNLVAGKLIGRYDARISAPFGSALAQGGDPSSTLIGASFNQAIGSYLQNNLKYTNPSSYITVSNAIGSWNFSHDGHPVPDVIPDIATALALRPTMKVLVLNGYHDLATPFALAERDLSRLPSTAPVTVRNYDSGHMIYLDDAARVKQKQDLRAFYLGTLQ